MDFGEANFIMSRHFSQQRCFLVDFELAAIEAISTATCQFEVQCREIQLAVGRPRKQRDPV